MPLRKFWSLILMASAPIMCHASVEFSPVWTAGAQASALRAGTSRLEFSGTRFRIRGHPADRQSRHLRRDPASTSAGHARSLAGGSRPEFQGQRQLHHWDRWPSAQRADPGERRAERRSYDPGCGAILALSPRDVQRCPHRRRGQGGVFQSLGKISTRMSGITFVNQARHA